MILPIISDYGDINQVVLPNLHKPFIVLAIGVVNFANRKCKNNKKRNDNRKNMMKSIRKECNAKWKIKQIELL